MALQWSSPDVTTLHATLLLGQVVGKQTAPVVYGKCVVDFSDIFIY